MKKIICVLLVVTLLTAIPLSIRAAENGEVNQITDTTVELYTPESLASVFTSVTNRAASGSSEIDEVTYGYVFEQHEDNLELADVSLTFRMVIGNNEYAVNASGTISAYELSSGEVLWEGPVRGDTVIGGLPCKVIAGVAKMESSPNVQVTATIQPLNGQEPMEPILFSFGENVITEGVYQELMDEAKSSTLDSEGVNTAAEEKTPTARSSGFLFLGTNLKLFYNLNAGTAQTLRGYFNPTTNQFAVSIMTHGYNFDNWARENSSIEPTTSVSSFEVRLTSNSQTGGSYSWIDNVKSYDFNVGNFDNGSVTIKPLFEDILSILGVPTSTISLMLDGLKGTVVDNIKSDTASVKVSFGLTQVADFDASSAGIPVVFQLDCVPSTYTGGSSYTLSSSITYRTYLWPTNSNTPRHFYADAYDASKTVTISLSN